MQSEEKLKLAQTGLRCHRYLLDNEIEEILFILPDLTKWANKITAYATNAAIESRQEIERFKVVEVALFVNTKMKMPSQKKLWQADLKTFIVGSLIL